jgi:hypothetical protein
MSLAGNAGNELLQALESEYVLTGRYLLMIEVVAEMEGLGFREKAITRRLERLFARRDRHLRRAARLLQDVRRSN